MPIYPVQACSCGQPAREVLSPARQAGNLRCECGAKLEQDYNEKGVNLDGAALSAWHGENATSIVDKFTRTRAPEVAKLFGSEHGGSAELQNCIDVKTGRCKFPNRKVREEWTKQRNKLANKGLIGGGADDPN